MYSWQLVAIRDTIKGSACYFPAYLSRWTVQEELCLMMKGTLVANVYWGAFGYTADSSLRSNDTIKGPACYLQPICLPRRTAQDTSATKSSRSQVIHIDEAITLLAQVLSCGHWGTNSCETLFGIRNCLSSFFQLITHHCWHTPSKGYPGKAELYATY